MYATELARRASAEKQASNASLVAFLVDTFLDE